MKLTWKSGVGQARRLRSSAAETVSPSAACFRTVAWSAALLRFPRSRLPTLVRGVPGFDPANDLRVRHAGSAGTGLGERGLDTRHIRGLRFGHRPASIRNAIIQMCHKMVLAHDQCLRESGVSNGRRRAFHAARRLTERRSVEDDLLGFAPFAERLSKVITRQNAPNGYVIGLH